jgi:N-carbamoylputrescine amidase
MPAKHKKIALIQMACAVDTQENLHKAAEFVREAARAGANIVCLPELFRAQYFCQREEHALFDTAESIPGPSTELLSKVCAEEGVVLIASLFERRAAGLYHNTAAIIEGDGSLAGKYRKMHIPDDPLYYEKTSVSNAGPLLKVPSALSSAGTSGIPKPPASPR